MHTPVARLRLFLLAFCLLYCQGAAAAAIMEDARHLVQERLFADASQLLDEHLARDPQDAEALLLRGIQNEHRRRYPEAMLDYLAALELKVTDEALYRSGRAHLRGFSESSETKTGMSLLQQAAELGQVDAQYELASWLLNKDPNDAQAQSFLVQAMDQGHLESLLVRARMYKYGLGSATDQKMAHTLFLAAAEEGSPEGQYEAGRAYRFGAGVEEDPLKAQFWNGKAYSQGDWRAQWMLGNDLYRDQNHELAIYEYWRSATAGFMPAQVNLGLAYMSGQGVDQNYGRAALWFAAANTVPLAQWNLGQLLLLGEGVDANPESAFRLFSEAAPKMGAAKAYLYMMYMTGTGTDPDKKEARRLYEELAESKDATTLNQAAWTLATTPIDALRNPKRALRLARSAVEYEPNVAHIDTLAAAWAGVGRFGRALKLQLEAMALPENYGADLRRELEEHLAAYEAGEPWIEHLRKKPARYSDVREISVLSEFTGEVVDLFPRSQERNPPGYPLSGAARYGLVILISQVQKGQLPHFMQEQAVFYIDSPGSFFSDVYPSLPAPMSFPEGIHRFVLRQINLRGDWYYRLDVRERARRDHDIRPGNLI